MRGRDVKAACTPRPLEPDIIKYPIGFKQGSNWTTIKDFDGKEIAEIKNYRIGDLEEILIRVNEYEKLKFELDCALEAKEGYKAILKNSREENENLQAQNRELVRLLEKVLDYSEEGLLIDEDFTREIVEKLNPKCPCNSCKNNCKDYDLLSCGRFEETEGAE